MRACTVVTCSHLPMARVLAESFLRHHAGGEVWVVVVDAEHPPPADLPGVRFMTPCDLGFDELEIQVRAALYDKDEFCCSFKPAALRTALVGSDCALYLDSDIEIYAGLDDIFAAARREGIVLSPHLMVPYPDDGLRPDHHAIVRAGTFNAGLVGVGVQGAPFLDWWGRMVARDAVKDQENGLASDQRWLTLVPGLFDCHVLQDPTVNVAYWNLHETPLEWGLEGASANGEKLRCFHFSGFDPVHPERLSRHDAGLPRLGPVSGPAVARLCRDYSRRLIDLGWESAAAYRFGSSTDGVALDTQMRRRWRLERLDFEHGEGHCPPNPFAPDAGFREWASPPSSRATEPRPLSELDAKRPATEPESEVDRIPASDGSRGSSKRITSRPWRVLLKFPPLDRFANLAHNVRILNGTVRTLEQKVALLNGVIGSLQAGNADAQSKLEELAELRAAAARAEESSDAALKHSAATGSILVDIERRLDAELKGS